MISFRYNLPPSLLLLFLLPVPYSNQPKKYRAFARAKNCSWGSAGVRARLAAHGSQARYRSRSTLIVRPKFLSGVALEIFASERKSALFLLFTQLFCETCRVVGRTGRVTPLSAFV
jgi:hypothetical protein